MNQRQREQGELLEVSHFIPERIARRAVAESAGHLFFDDYLVTEITTDSRDLAQVTHATFKGLVPSENYVYPTRIDIDFMGHRRLRRLYDHIRGREPVAKLNVESYSLPRSAVALPNTTGTGVLRNIVVQK